MLFLLLLVIAIFQKTWLVPIILGILVLIADFTFILPWYSLILIGIGMKMCVSAIYTFETQIDRLVQSYTKSK